MFKIVLVEDHKEMRQELAILLESQGYSITAIDCFDDVAGQVIEESPHLVLLDINLPSEDGFSICTKIRSKSKVPIIFVTSRNQDVDELMSITLGGDDFITKPYNRAILLARIQSILARVYDKASHTLQHKELILHLGSSEAEYKGQKVELTKNELKILHCLMRNKDRIVSRADIIEYLWDHELFVNDNTLTVNITRIRHKLEELGVVDYIHTKRRQGYSL